MSQYLWRVLVVDDREAEDIDKAISGKAILGEHDEIIVTTCVNFSDAVEKIKKYRFDLTILDLKDDDEMEVDDGEDTAGEKVFKEIKSLRFMPIIFYSAVAHKVKNLESPFVKVVTREGAVGLRPIIKEIFDTKIPHLMKHLEEEQRNYMWDQLSKEGSKFYSESYDSTEATYLLARRLANVLESSSIKRFLSSTSATGQPIEDNKLHPIEIYIYPSINSKLLSGDIVKFNFKEQLTYGVIMTPSCDFHNNKISYILVAKCEYLKEQPEFDAVKAYWDELEKAPKGTQPNQSPLSQLEKLMDNKRQGKGVQPERYHFLPGTFFLPDLIVDFKFLLSIPETDIDKLKRVASIDSPFAEEITARFSKFYNRIGLPDMNFREATLRLQKEYTKSKNKA